MIRLLLPVCAALLLVACDRTPVAPAGAPVPDAPAVPNDTPAGQRIEADVRVLADDRMQGRLTGSAGHDLASRHVAERFEAIGLEPAGDDGSFFQRVPLARAVVVRDGARLDIARNGRTIRLRFGEQFLPLPNFNVADSNVTATAVFVGQAIHAPELGHNDFGDIDLRGRIAVVFGGAPDTFPATQRAYYSSSHAKAEAVAARGAVGLLMVNTAADEAGSPWSRTAERWSQPAMRLRGSGGTAVDGFPQLRATAVVAATSADLVFADGPRSAAQLFDAARTGTLTPFVLPGRMTLANRTRIDRLESRNVLGRLPGRDPALSRESVVHTAHLDHIGIGPGVDGDTIHNGAIDNALGVAIMIEAARELQAAAQAPRRSTVFAALTGEEQGLLGATWLARYPTPAAGRAIANINIDMPVLTAPTRDIVAIGTEHSTLAAAVARAAAEVGVELSPDPFPEEVAFVRSDQYAFVRAGVPAVYLDAGVAPANDSQNPKLAATWFLRNCYHRPCDQVDLPIHYADAARLSQVSAALGRIIGEDPTPPAWNPGDVFGQRFGAAAAR